MVYTVIVIEVLRCCDEVVKFWILGSLDLLDLVVVVPVCKQGLFEHGDWVQRPHMYFHGPSVAKKSM